LPEFMSSAKGSEFHYRGCGEQVYSEWSSSP
jgi:hypothetical protein